MVKIKRFSGIHVIFPALNNETDRAHSPFFSTENLTCRFE